MHRVTNTADSGPGTLREALAGAADGDVIDATGVSGTITLTNGGLFVSNSVAILGPGPATLTVSGNNAFRVLAVAGTQCDDQRPDDCQWPGRRLRHGDQDGGAGSRVTINNCVITTTPVRWMRRYLQ